MDLLDNEHKAMVPGLWLLETRNSLIVNMRKKKLSTRGCSSFLAALNELPVHVDHQPDLEEAFSLAVMHNLTFYEAVYLELAKRSALPIATFDRAIAKAAQAEKLPLVCKKIP